MAQPFLAFIVSPPRNLQLQKVAGRWHEQIAKCLKVTKDLIIQLPFEETYILQTTSQPKTYNGNKLAELEKDRVFLLTPSPNTTDNIILSLTYGICTINFFSKVDGITLIERKALQKLNLTLSLRFRVFEFTLSSDTNLRMCKPNHKLEAYQFEEKGQTMNRKTIREEETRIQEAEKNGQVISDAVSSSILVCMQKFLQVQGEQQEQERKRRIELDKILQNIKQEGEVPLGELFPDTNTQHLRQRRRSEENPITYRTSLHPARLETSSMMESFQPFTSLLPPLLQPLPQLSSFSEFHSAAGASSLPPRPLIPPLSMRPRTTEQMSVISDLSSRFQGEKLGPNLSEGSQSSSETTQSKTVKNKIKTYLNQLAGSEEYREINFPSILRQLTVQAENEEEGEY